MAKKYTTEEAKERMRIQRQEWRLRNPEKVKEKMIRDNLKAKEKRLSSMKVCRKCGESKYPEAFPPHGTGKSGVCQKCVEEKKAKDREYRTELRKKNPEKVLAKQKRDNELAKERRAKLAAEKVVSPKPTGKVCKVCGERKELDLFPVHGTGKSSKCKACTPPPKTRYEIQRAYELKNRPKINAVKLAWAKKHKPVNESRCALKVSEPKSAQEFFGDWRQKFIKDGWRCLGGLGDDQEQITVFIRGWIVMYIRGSKGTYSTGKASFGVLFDDKQPRITSLGKAEARARRMYGVA